VTKWSVLRKMIILQVRRSAKNKPKQHSMSVTTCMDDSCSDDTNTANQREELLAVAEAMAAKLHELLQRNPPTNPVAIHACTTQAFGEVMMNLMPVITSGSPPDSAAVFELMVIDTIVKVVQTTIPDEYNELFKLLAMADKVVLPEGPDGDQMKTRLMPHCLSSGTCLFECDVFGFRRAVGMLHAVQRAHVGLHGRSNEQDG
jgi:hypothetical protein